MGVPGIGGSNRIDYTGQRFGKLTVVRLDSRGTRNAPVRWLCACDCGKEKAISARSLRTGRSNSCGCLVLQNSGTRTHGMTRTATYRTWASMIGRCRNPAHKDYPLYGGRGIVICESWASFDAFLVDMGVRPAGMELDRIDNNGNYDPHNCRWTSHKENSRNTRKCRMVTLRGETLPISAWAERLGMSEGTIRSRLNRGYSPEAALSNKAIKRGAGSPLYRMTRDADGRPCGTRAA